MVLCYFFFPFIWIRQVKAPFKKRGLACPFYIYNPTICQGCFASDLRSIKDMIGHLFESHSRPVYCATCYNTFDDLVKRDDHALRNQCRKSTPGPLFGLSERQKAELMKINLDCTVDEGWLRIWHIVFPEEKDPVLPPRIQSL
ncbi:hypothetical protein FOXG_20914 [Fusarium oxysporum f. sp. lycopersici 4287]|uniref:C2H2-type domain-containing protein n=1 Tax=Fusarium oxysporum f. sp. lycopersici (strain 4287 / CBS 123668 / FGSC 9935 / NRRL 34936) TaxID=426428 RepID=A0A0J9VS18_FUSO4|nr:hypothetical protein FOXG_20914 [Fusarium oxysporum f. sp. lycopersici 4287]EWZ78180.1 hypothetical protein FOWG_17510 [Fusarium oxysporum f. sp. lycopersici MN25]KAJ9413013.1 hypothetical protein QL093DRAFT_1129279 [Fusarium oxysporum]KNB13769.1 hypothetical protein FOXG_20914 [Fusarium oxysporum f. sp. lycopersici 4287]